jgi:signal transduction histidine kinase/ActR/RegA family two-component response regulator
MSRHDARFSLQDMTTIRDRDASSRHSNSSKGNFEAIPARRMDELETVIAAGRIGFCQLDASFRVLSANAQFKAEFGWAPDAQFAWSELMARVHPDDRDALRAALDTAFNSGAELDIAVRVNGPRVGGRCLQLRGRSISEEDGTTRRLVIVANDVTTRYLEHAASADRRSRFLVDLVTCMTQTSDARQVAQIAAARLGEFLEVERVVIGEVDTQSESLRTVAAFKTPAVAVSEPPLVSFKVLAAVARSERSLVVSSSQVSESAEQNQARATLAVPVYRKGEWAGALVVDDGSARNWSNEDVLLVEAVARIVWPAYERQMDTAEHMRRERELRATAEQANRSKDEFLSMFSHELRSPLNAILGWNQILGVKRASDSEVVAIATRIERSAKAQLKMVNDLLDLGRITTGKLKIEARRMKLATVMNAAIEAVRPMAAAKSIAIIVEADSTSGEMHGDADRLQQVVWNILSNAVKFTDSGGRIGTTLQRFGDWLELSVTDTGQGIAPELLPHVFDRFRQGDNSTTRHSGGLGLGLAVVREIVALHGGSVSVSSDGQGHGATFTVRLPAPYRRDTAQDERDYNNVRGAPGNSLSGLSILVVDDEPDARAVVAETLRLEGAEVTVSDSAGSAFAELRAEGAHFDVVVTDIGMPVEDGYSLVRKLRSMQLGRNIIAIALTGYASHTDKRAALEAGFDVHVAKPVDFEDFVPLICRMARQTRPAHGH